MGIGWGGVGGWVGGGGGAVVKVRWRAENPPLNRQLGFLEGLGGIHAFNMETDGVEWGEG